MGEHLNTDAMAVLAVIQNEAAATGKCTLPVARIAERANVGRAKVRAAIRLAERLGIIAIEVASDRKRMIINRGVTSRGWATQSSFTAQLRGGYIAWMNRVMSLQH
jgi:DNA-binding Lrp family transcriptional regulator